MFSSNTFYYTVVNNAAGEFLRHEMFRQKSKCVRDSHTKTEERSFIFP